MKARLLLARGYAFRALVIQTHKETSRTTSVNTVYIMETSGERSRASHSLQSEHPDFNFYANASILEVVSVLIRTLCVSDEVKKGE